MKKAILKKFIYCLFILPSFAFIIILSSCADLGVYGDESSGFDDFYDSFGDIVGKFEATSGFEDVSYDVEKSLTNEYIMQNLIWEDVRDEVDYLEYVYIVIPFKRDLKIEEIALYVASDSNVINNVGINLEFSAFYFKNSDSCPKDNDFKKKSDPDTKIEKDSNGNDVEVEIEYGDPKKENRISSASLSVSHDFDSFVLSNFHQTVDIGESYVSDSCLLAKKNSYLYIRIENNSALNRNLTPVSISFINLLIRAV